MLINKYRLKIRFLSVVMIAAMGLCVVGCPPPFDEPVADFSATPSSGKFPLTANFSDQSIGDIYSWEWDFGDGTMSTLQNPKHTYQLAGSYSPSLTVTGAKGSDTMLKDRYINPVDRPVLNFDSTVKTGDAPVEIQFNDKSSNTDLIASWLWDFGDGQSSTDRNPSHRYERPGKYAVALTVTCQGSSEKISVRKEGYIIVTELVEFASSNPIGIGPVWALKTRGDCDFKGHGPDIDVSASLELRNSGRGVDLLLSIVATETEPDLSTGQGSKKFPLGVSIPRGFKVYEFVSQSKVSYFYTDSNHDYDYSPPFELGRFKILGDTDNGDICNTSYKDTHVIFENIYFKMRIGPQ